MDGTPAGIELHYALWGALTIPLGFAGLVFVLPGLIFTTGLILLAVSAVLLLYVSRLSQGDRRAWLAGLAVHALVVLAAPLYIAAWPTLLAVPLALANLYSLVVLFVHRGLWSRGRRVAAAAA